MSIDNQDRLDFDLEIVKEMYEEMIDFNQAIEIFINQK